MPSRKRWDPEGSQNLEPQKRPSLYWKHLRQKEIPGFPLLLAHQSSAVAPIGQTKIHLTVKPDSKDSDMELSMGRRGKDVRTDRKLPYLRVFIPDKATSLISGISLNHEDLKQFGVTSYLSRPKR